MYTAVDVVIILILDRLFETKRCGSINDRAISWAKADQVFDNLIAHFCFLLSLVDRRQDLGLIKVF